MNITDRYLLGITCPGRKSFISAESSNQFSTIGERSGMDWKFVDPSVPHRTLILVSKFAHCPNDPRYRKLTAELNIDVTTVASNHLALSPKAHFHQVPLKVLSGNRSKLSTKAKQEELILELAEGQGGDLVILARYKQVLLDELRRNPAGLCINIHHSRSPSSKRARPHHKAHKAGVKAIGVTAHCARLDLDEGPITVQEVVRVDQPPRLSQLLATGRNVETDLLYRAVKAYIQHRLFLNGHKTVVLK